MSAVHLLAYINRLNIPLTTLAAIGAELKLRLDGEDGDPGTRAMLGNVARAADPALLEGATEAEMESALGFVRAFLREALDLVEQPARSPGWRYEDPALLQGMGTGSQMFVGRIDSFGATRPDLQAILDGDGRFLDIGTGAGGLALAAARRWRRMQVVGIDIWEPSLALARAAVAASEVADRIELRCQNLLDLAEQEAFSLIWFPTIFTSAEVTLAALPRLQAAMTPGGWLVLGLFRIPPDPLGSAAAKLRVLRSGGHPWQPYELAARLEKSGFEAVEMLEAPTGACNVIARRKALLSGSFS